MNRGEREKRINRREFFPHFSVVVGMFLAALTFPFLKIYPRVRKISLSQIKKLPDGISLIDELVVNKEGEKLRIYSRRCTHLGCKLQKGQKAPLHCPCHGSEFSETGEVLRGPADKPLPKISFRREKNFLLWRS